MKCCKWLQSEKKKKENDSGTEKLGRAKTKSTIKMYHKQEK